MLGGGSASNVGPGSNNRDHEGVGDNGLGPAGSGRDVAGTGGTPHVNETLIDKPAEQRGRPAERIVFGCTSQM